MVLSLDFELAWGSFDRAPRGPLLAAARWTHDTGAPMLLQLLSRYGLPATWATVGALMHDGLPPAVGAQYAASGVQPVWLSGVPRNRGEREAPQWFAPRFVERLQRCTTPQEVGLHGWSHISLGPEASPQLVDCELALCRKTALSTGVEGAAFVYPRNRVGDPGQLARHGFRIYRSPDPVAFGRVSSLAQGRARVRSVALLAADALALAPPLVTPAFGAGVVSIPGSLMVRYAAGFRGVVPDTWRHRRLALGLRHVLKRGGIFHVWLHPINLHARHPRLFCVLEAFFARVARLRDSGKLEVLTLGEIAERWHAQHSPSVSGSHQFDH